ncbi:MAG TPA: thioredoxin domain-containing protein [Solirubrobacteraceae bacterium]|jgi:hypothetical protein
MPNRLAGESSPYLLQHSDNPVDWNPWGEAALSRAGELDRPLLVSIGYSACHWCHVMAHESFEDPEVAALMDAHFICVKVDREEHPDVDAMCMEACQAMTGHGGWPLNAFLTPELVPFFAGTYFPPESRHGLPSWRMVLQAVADAWENRRQEIRQQGPEMLRRLGATATLRPADEPLSQEGLAAAAHGIRESYDRERGGFGGAPKFPQADVIEFLLARGDHEPALQTLRAMARGGIYDQIGGGFARYSVDAAWRVPHFEKMLYDNALLARAYLHGWQVSGEPRMAEVCSETLDWALRELAGPEGGFCSSLDADSEGEEGRFYTWTTEQIRTALSEPLAGQAIEHFGAVDHGNFERGLNVLQASDPPPAGLPEIRCKLFGARMQRVRPGLDEKRLTSWNALMVAALAEAGAVLGNSAYTEAAVRCAEFIVGELRRDDGGLLRTWRDGRARIDGYLDDYAFLLEALITLYESTLEPRFYHEAVQTADALIERFGDTERGGFFTTAADRTALPIRRKDLEDSPVPSGNSAAAFGLLRLALLSGAARYEQAALGALQLLFPLARRHPLAFGHLLRAADFHLASVREVAIVGEADEAQTLLDVVRERYRPHVVLAGGAEDGVPLLAGRKTVAGQPAAYVCEHFACQAPVTSAAELEEALSETDILKA